MCKPACYRKRNAPENPEEMLCREDRNVDPNTLEQREAANDRAQLNGLLCALFAVIRTGRMNEIKLRDCDMAV